MESSAGWNIHFVVLGALAVAGVALTIYDLAGPSSGGPISLRGLVSTLYWMAYAVFGVASTATLALLRARLGAPLSYAAAVPVAAAFAAVVWFGGRAIEQLFSGKASERLARDLASRLTLESWSMAEEADGVIRFRVAVRADLDESIAFEPSAAIGGSVAVERAERTSERALRAGERAVFEAIAYRSTPGTFDSIDLYLISWIRDRETGSIVYTTETREDALTGSLLKRPLPPPSAVAR